MREYRQADRLTNPPPANGTGMEFPTDLERRIALRQAREDWYHRILYPHDAEIQSMLENVPWLVPGILPASSLIVLASAPKAGKSFFASALARAVVEGKPFLGREVKAGNVVWLNYEESVRERGLSHFHWRPDPDCPFRVWTTDEFLFLDEPESFECFEYWLRELQPTLMVVDSLHAATEHACLRENHGARRVMMALKRLTAHGVSVLVLHHLAKSPGRRKRLADSAQIAAAASMSIVLDAYVESNGVRRLQLRCRGRGAVNQTLNVVSHGPGDYRLSSRNRPLTRYHAVLEALKSGPLTALELVSATRLAPGTVRMYLAELLRSGVVRRLNRDDRKFKYGVADAEIGSVRPPIGNNSEAA